MKTHLLVGALLLPAVLAAQESPGPGECAPCHPAAGVQWQEGVHAREGMVCADCHGGDPMAIEAQRGHHGMRRFESAEEILTVCGGCHAEASRMRPYNLAADQLALYRESTHGRSRLGGNEAAPVCTSCHLNHHVLAASDPASPVSAANLVRTCGSCHEDAEVMRECGCDERVVDGFASSPHARTLGAARQPTGPGCATCHDGHGAAVPRNTDVDEICGACHEATRASLRAGSHAKLLRREDLRGCASCHSVHDGLRARSAGTICLDCHDEGSTQTVLGGDLERMMRETEEELKRAEMALLRAHRAPLDARDHEALVEDSRQYLQSAAARFHTFERQPIESLTRASRSIAVRVQDEIDRGLERRTAREALSLIWFYAAITLAVLARYRWLALDRGSS